jgi:hypothetical protein
LNNQFFLNIERSNHKIRSESHLNYIVNRGSEKEDEKKDDWVGGTMLKYSGKQDHEGCFEPTVPIPCVCLFIILVCTYHFLIAGFRVSAV